MMILVIPGILVGGIFFYFWRNSPKKWQKVIAYIAGLVAVLSLAVLLFGLIAGAINPY
jgi:hypothetical protein